MAFEDLKKDLTETDADVRSYLRNSEEYYKLKIFRVLMGMVTTSAQMILVGAIALLALLMLSLAASLVIGEVLDSFYYGFVIVGTIYVFIAAICYLLRDRLNGSLLRKFSKHYFD
ncbi:hypothetical protein [Ulvibacterium sp.]|uniref:hypothetical protein n=1 Tax=Ulvibacterium sp. TaxID=2665914 RepID=UPI003BAB444C